MSKSVTKFYDSKKKTVVLMPSRVLIELKPKIVQIIIGDKSTKLKMAPEWFKHDNQNKTLQNIVYPEGITDNEQHQFDVVARYRAASNKPNNNFREAVLHSNESNAETLVIALDNFVQQFGGELSFTNEDLTFKEPAHRTACGIGDLSSAHLLATNYIPTAQFSFLVDLDYQTDLARSSETMQNFVLNFANAIADVLTCSNDYVRVISVDKPGKTRYHTKINFGLTTPNPTETEQLVEELKVRARDGFTDHRILKHVKKDKYEYKWKPLITYFQLKTSDFVSEFNIDYTSSMPTKDKRGGYPYYLPIGWYRHALKVVDKYPDDKLWLGSNNVDGEWPVAFHGTHGGAVKGIKEKGLLITKHDAMRNEAIEQKGDYFGRPGLYVATHCRGGAHPVYTTPFTIHKSPETIETFRVVFQCRVKPDAFTIHTGPVEIGQAWRFVDPDAVRPYGILVKNESTAKSSLEDVE
ncbi:unnamed protein product [Rotaria sp. Silwood2]|nr:unnamed protein product [Rotaria sp. Silwood2]CAF2773928.1 unnamed protein product [Rotaria sp. Silwood2]CAF2949212.1 unnamed protein product [Rotaria sp. Silwood2]CAF3044907.1 unnamed protein product [Rotaria sp. Silwood2]CAF3960308.1 unnamed protein product [Rotaria sp. Silwood2]